MSAITTSRFSQIARFSQILSPAKLFAVIIARSFDGNTDAVPTYWFWHPWACAGNHSGCPWIGHSNASRIFDGYVATVGHGGVLNMNIAPDATGRMNASVVAVMHEAGKAINDTFKLHNVAIATGISAPCGVGTAVLNVSGAFDYVMSMEDLRHGQRIGNYSIEFRRHQSHVWEMLVPPVQSRSSRVDEATGRLSERDRPDGHDPRDQYVGHRRIDTPIVNGSVLAEIAQVRFNCIRVTHNADPAEGVFLRQFSLHKKIVPWESKQSRSLKSDDSSPIKATVRTGWAGPEKLTTRTAATAEVDVMQGRWM